MHRCLLIAVMLLLASPPGSATVKTIGQGGSLRVDPSVLPPEMKAANVVMQTKCIKCHSLERTIVAVNSGVAPISGRPFDRAAIHEYSHKMIRKPDSCMTKEEIKQVEDLLIYLMNTNVPRKP